MSPAERTRTPLNRARVLNAAVDLADRIGVDALTIRRLAAALGVKPMALYHHVAGKDDILDGMVDLVFAEIDVPPTDEGWRAAIETRCGSMREVLGRHPWAVTLLDSRTSPGPATLRHHEAVLACLRGAGFSLALTAHAVATLDAFVYGFAVQEASLPFSGPDELEQVAGAVLADIAADELPHFVEFATRHALAPGYSFGASFDFGPHPRPRRPGGRRRPRRVTLRTRRSG